MAENDDVTSSSCGQPNSSAKLPTKLTALKLYSDSRMEVLISLGKSDEEINKMCMSEYKMMPDEQKLKWIRLAVEKSPVYLSELSQFLAEEKPLKKRKFASSQPAAEKENFNQLDCGPNEPIPESKSQPLSSLGYALFSRQLVTSEKFRVLRPKDREIQLSIHWNRLSEKEKNEFNVQAEKFKQFYPLEFSNYLNCSLPPIEQGAAPTERIDEGEKQVEDPENTSWIHFNIIATEDSYLNLNLKNIIGKELLQTSKYLVTTLKE